MRVIIAGSRYIWDDSSVQKIMDSCFPKRKDVREIILGSDKGIGMLGDVWAEENNKPVKRFFPDWDRNGKRAGFSCNEQMAKYASGKGMSGGALVLVWDGMDRMYSHLKEMAEKYNLSVFEKIIEGYSN